MMTNENCAPVHEDAPEAIPRNPKRKQTARISVKPNNILSSVNVIVHPDGSSSSSVKRPSPAYTPYETYKETLEEVSNGGVNPSEFTPIFVAAPCKENGDHISLADSAIFDLDVARGLATGCILPKDAEGYAFINDQSEILGICIANTFRLLSSLNRAREIQKLQLAEREKVIQAALANAYAEIARLHSVVAEKNLKIDNLEASLDEFN